MKSAVCRSLLVLAAALAVLAAPAAAQVLPAGHWARTVAARVDAARLTERGFDAAAATLSVRELLHLLEDAAGRAEAADHPLQLQLLDWLERLRAEYPAAAA